MACKSNVRSASVRQTCVCFSNVEALEVGWAWGITWASVELVYTQSESEI